MIVVLGAGLAGISCSYHLGHDCLVFEKNDHIGGHIFSHKINGFTWDEGPHVSFTKNKYVKDLFEESVEGDYLEYPVFPINYYKGHWVPHPAQSNLHAVPELIKERCLKDFLESRDDRINKEPENYQEWLLMAFGQTFTDEFVSSYTKKYWTLAPKFLTTDWVGNRVYYPDVKTVIDGASGPLPQSTHYITSVRYPRKGGYFSYTNKLAKGINVACKKEVVRVDLKDKTIYFSDETQQAYTKLINTLPITDFVDLIEANEEIKGHAQKLSCSELLLINVVIDHEAVIDSQWLYVYDDDKYSTRINFTELLSPENGTKGKCGIQVEVYFSKYKPQTADVKVITAKVISELIEMGLVKDEVNVEEVHTNYVKYANVIFDHHRRESLDSILNYLSDFGLVREKDDLAPMTDWEEIDLIKNDNNRPIGDLVMAGRFGQWKYYWTDDCVLRGLDVASRIRNGHQHK